MRLPLFVCVVCAHGVLAKTQFDYNELNQPGAQFYNGRNLEIQVGAESTMELLQRWHDQAFSGLFAAFANQKVQTLKEEHKNSLEECSKNADSPRAQAQCVVKILDSTEGKKTKQSAKLSSSKLSEKAIAKLRKYAKKRTEKEAKMTLKAADKWIGGFKVKRAKRSIVVQRSNFTLLTKDSNRSPLGVVAKQLASVIRAVKNKNETIPWSTTVTRLQEKAKKIRWEKEFEKQMKKRLNLSPNGERRQKHVNKSARPKAGRFTDHPEEDLLFEKIDEYENKVNQSSEEKTMRGAMQLLRDGVKLGLMISGQNVTDFDKKTVKLGSPRIMPVVPEEKDSDTLSLLSPALFSLYNGAQDEIDNITSIAQLLSRLPNNDHEDWLNLIVEAAGVADQVQKLESLEEDKTERFKRQTGLNGRPLYFTRENVTEIYGDFEKRKVDTHEQLITGLAPQQLDQMSKTGYTFMTKEQLHHFYGPSSPYNSTEALHRLTALHGNITDKHIEHDLRIVAEMKDFNLRQKDILLSPVINSPLIFAGPLMSQPIVLSPVVLSPAILSPAVLGPVILSPWVFIPVILSPRVLSPLILNPLIFSPIILSPLVLHPLILSPGVFNPIILSPLVLSPLILSPQVFSPLILSPMALNPLILNPGVGGPLILSPFVLSPLIASPQVLFAVVLSPYALSPLIQSELIASSVVLSPSWLS